MGAAKRLIWTGLGLAVCALIAVGVWSVRSGAPRVVSDAADEGPAVLGVVPDFSLTERSGRTVTRADLSGRPWIADFIFTHCAGVCPLLSAGMAQLQRTLGEQGIDARLVSITVDPARDSPAVLREYADRFRADRERWLFLTGERQALYDLIRDGFRLSVAERPPGGTPRAGDLITHSDRFVLVDVQGRIRGYYDGTDRAELARLLRDLAVL